MASKYIFHLCEVNIFLLFPNVRRGSILVINSFYLLKVMLISASYQSLSDVFTLISEDVLFFSFTHFTELEDECLICVKENSEGLSYFHKPFLGSISVSVLKLKAEMFSFEFFLFVFQKNEQTGDEKK